MEPRAELASAGSDREACKNEDIFKWGCEKRAEIQLQYRSYVVVTIAGQCELSK